MMSLLRRQGRPGQRRHPGRRRGHRPGRRRRGCGGGGHRPPAGARAALRRRAGHAAAARRRTSARTSPTSSRPRPVSSAVVSGTAGSTAWSTPPGSTSRGTLLDTTPELFDEHVAINLKAPFFLMQAAVRGHAATPGPGHDRQRDHDVGTRRSALPRAVRRRQGRSGRPDPERGARAPLGPDPDQRGQHRLDRDRGRGRRPAGASTAPRTAGSSDAAADLPMGKLGQPDDVGRTSSSCCCRTAAASSPVRSSTGTRTCPAPTTERAGCEPYRPVSGGEATDPRHAVLLREMVRAEFELSPRARHGGEGKGARTTRTSWR